MPGLFNRVKVWATEALTKADLNAEFNNIINNFEPQKMDDYSSSVGQMQTQTSPGSVGSESRPTSLSGELERIRYQIAAMTGETYWYTAPDTTLSSVASTLDGLGLSPPNQIISGAVNAGSGPICLDPDGSAASVTLLAASTNLVYKVAGVQYTANANSTLTGLPTMVGSGATYQATVAAPDPGSYGGEDEVDIVVTSMGSEIQNLIGQFAAFKVVHGGSTEYFVAYVKNTTTLSHARRGYFFDGSQSPISRVSTIAAADTITLQKLSYIFVKTDGTLDYTSTQLRYGSNQPASAAAGDYWFDTSVDYWKKYSGTSWASAGATLLGCTVQNTSACVGARTYNFQAAWSKQNGLFCETVSGGLSVVNNSLGGSISVAGNLYSFPNSSAKWTTTGPFASGVTLANSTRYFFYVQSDGGQIIDTVKPYQRVNDLGGFYHPYFLWRCVGEATTDGSSLFGTFTNYVEAPRESLPAVGQQISSVSSGSTTSSTLSDVTGLTVTITTRGRPVMLSVQGGSTQASFNNAAGVAMGVKILRGSTTIAYHRLSIASSATTPAAIPVSLQHLDIVGAGTYTYKVQLASENNLNEVILTGAYLVAYEL